MILTLNEIEKPVLLLHMSVMRKNVKKGFKKSYGSQEGKELLKSYDEIHSSLKESFEEAPGEGKTLHLNIKEVNMIHSFIGFYIPQLEKTLSAAGKINEEDQQQIEALKEVGNKIDQMVSDYA